MLLTVACDASLAIFFFKKMGESHPPQKKIFKKIARLTLGLPCARGPRFFFHDLIFHSWIFNDFYCRVSFPISFFTDLFVFNRAV
jgi:hypothetical protein